jgi:hypothetical protein
VAKLTADEEQLLEQLSKKRDAPDEPAGSGRNVNITIDLSDGAAVKRALSLGLIDKGDLAEFDDDADDAGDDAADDDPADDEPAPRRRLSLADRTMGTKE